MDSLHKSGLVPGNHGNGGGWRTKTYKNNQTDPGPPHPMVLYDQRLHCDERQSHILANRLS